MKEKILLSLLLVAMTTSIAMVSAAPDSAKFGGEGEAFEEIMPTMFNNTNNGLIIQWADSETSPHHIGITTPQPGTHANENAAVEDSGLPGESDVKPKAVWGASANRK